MSSKPPYDLDLSRPTRELVIEVATRLISQGEKPAVSNVRAIIGKGSNLTIQSALNDWWKDLGKRIDAQYHHPTLPDSVVAAAAELWTVALREADLANEKYRQEADALVVDAESRARAAGEAQELAEEGRNVVMGEMDSAKATIEGLERTLAAETAHKNALAKQVVELTHQSKEARKESENARKEASKELARVRREASDETEHARSSAAEEIELARKEFHDQITLAQERFNAIEKRMLMEIERERQNSASVRATAQKEAERVQINADLEIAKLRQSNNGLITKNNTLVAQLSKLEGKIEEIRDRQNKLSPEMAAEKVLRRRKFRRRG